MMKRYILIFLLTVMFAMSIVAVSEAAIYYASSKGSGTTCSATDTCTLAYTCQTKAAPNDWIMVQDDISATVDCSANPGTSGNQITIVGKKHLLGTLTLGNYYTLYGGNELASLTFGATSNFHYPYGIILLVGTEITENYQVDDDVSWWENYLTSDGAGGWENYRVTE